MKIGKWIVTLVGNFLFHFVFASSLLAGAMGITAILMFWPKREADEGNLLVGVGLLCLGAVVLGLMGIAKFRNKRMRLLDAETDLAQLRKVNPLANVLTGAFVLVGCGFVIYWQVTRPHPGDHLIEIPVVGMACGVLQLLFGVFQLITGNRGAAAVQRPG